MHSTANRTWLDKTSATLRATVITGSGSLIRPAARPTTATGSHVPVRPSRHGFTLPDRSPNTFTPRRHASSGWGEAPLVLSEHANRGSPYLQSRRRDLDIGIKILDHIVEEWRWIVGLDQRLLGLAPLRTTLITD